MTYRTFVDLKNASLNPRLRDTVDSTHLEIISVKSKGAKGDTDTDDSAAIQEAINSAGSRNAIFFPSGVYGIGEEIDITDLFRLTLFSSGKNAKLKALPGSNLNYIFEVIDCDFFEIYGLEFDGVQASQTSGTQDALRIKESARVTVRDLYIGDFGGTSIAMNGVSGDRMFQPILDKIRIRDGGGKGIHFSSNIFDAQLSNIWVGDGTDNGIQVDAGCDSCVLVNVHSWGHSAGDAIQIAAAQTRISNSYFEQSDKGMDLFGSSGTLIENTAVRNNTGQGISMQDADRCKLSNSNVEDNGAAGLSLNGATHCSVLGSTFEGNAFQAISISGAAFDNIVNENTFIDHADGITVSGTSDRNQIRFNNLTNAITNKIANTSSGAYNVIEDNVVTTTGVPSFTSADATPSVLLGDVFQTANAGSTTITNFDDGYEGKQIKVLIQDTNTTIDFTGSNLKGNVGVDWTPTTDDHMTCVFDGTDWYCDISDNTA